MRVRLINLDRDQDRLAEFCAFNAHMTDIERMSAVDGGKQDIAALVRDGILDRAIVGRYTAGSIGNALSHLALWNESVDSGGIVTVCEDDAIFHRQFNETAGRAIAALPADWD